MGLFSAYYLCEHVDKVIVIEKENGPAGASQGNAGMIVPSHFLPLAAPGVISQSFKWMGNPSSPFYIKPRLNKNLISWGINFAKASRSQKFKDRVEALNKINLESRKLYDELIEERHFRIAFEPKGLLMHCLTIKYLEKEKKVAKLANELGVEAQILSRTEVDDLEKGVEMNVAGSIYYPQDAFLTPELLINQLKSYLVEKGVEFKVKESITDFEIEGDKIFSVTSNGEIINADQFVLTAGIWSTEIAKNLNIMIPMEAGKGYSFTLTNPKVKPEICSILVESKVAVTPMETGVRFGGTMELSGMDNKVNKKRVEGIINAIPKYMNGIYAEDFKSIVPWFGYRPLSPDGLPFIGRPKSYSNLTVSTGHSMMGLSLGPVSGKMVSEILLKNKIVDPLFSVDRFS